MSKSRTWTFTINNYAAQTLETLETIDCKYIIYGREWGLNNTPHIQGYVVWKNAKTMSATKAALDPYRPERPHVEIARGNALQNAEYCSKGEQPHDEWEEHGTAGENYGKNADVCERGTRPKTQQEKGAGEKRRYEEAWELAKAGQFEEIDADIRLRHYSTLKKIRQEFQPAPESIADIEGKFWWFFGPSGSGKSYAARAEHPDHYIKNKNKWWCGYTGQKCVIIEEWNPDVCVGLKQMLKEWADHHPFCAETKGGSVQLRPPMIIVTSNYSLEECFMCDRPGLYEPLRRRFTVREFH